MAKFTIVNAGAARQHTYIKALIYGESGAGKSYLAATAPRPLILLTEMNGQASISHSNPDASIIHIKSDAMLGEVLRDIEANPKSYEQFDTIVIDSLTEMQRLIRDRIANGKVFKLQDWGAMADNMRAMIRKIRNINKHVVCLALLESQVDETTGERHLKPAFDGRKTGGEIAQYFNFVGFLYKQQVATESEKGVTTKHIVRKLMLEGPARVMCKPCAPLTGTVTEPNINEIFSQITK